MCAVNMLLWADVEATCNFRTVISSSGRDEEKQPAASR